MIIPVNFFPRQSVTIKREFDPIGLFSQTIFFIHLISFECIESVFKKK